MSSGAEGKSAPVAFWKRHKGQNKYHHVVPGGELPQIHIWYAIVEFGIALGKTKEKGGAYLQIYHHSTFRRGKMQNEHHHDDQWAKLPQIHILEHMFGAESI